ncbi:MAG: hypothetical protein IKJ76_01550 [Fibrobacter sp.]|nr:hypothetical protein [Fibrobacter sp.]
MKPKTKATLISWCIFLGFVLVAAILFIIYGCRERHYDEIAQNLAVAGCVSIFIGVIVSFATQGFVEQKVKAYYEAHLPPEEIERRAVEAKKMEEFLAKRKEEDAKREKRQAELRKEAIASKTDAERLYDLEEKVDKLLRENNRFSVNQNSADQSSGGATLAVVIAAIILGYMISSSVKDIKDEINTEAKEIRSYIIDHR